MSKIEWCDVTWNPITGCSPISEGCENCYAKRMANRLQGRFGYPAKPNQFLPMYHFDRLTVPSRWKKPKKIFVCSMGDLFHEDVPHGDIDQVFTRMWNSIIHTFLVLTKRPQKLLDFYHDPSYEWSIICQRGFTHIWFGVTAENQKRADERIPILLQIPAAVRFVSVEPMIGPVTFRWAKWKPLSRTEPTNHLDGLRMLDWVIAGPETGPKARECKPEWIKDLYEQCKSAGVPFFDKRKTGWLAREFPK